MSKYILYTKQNNEATVHILHNTIDDLIYAIIKWKYGI